MKNKVVDIRFWLIGYTGTQLCFAENSKTNSTRVESERRTCKNLQVSQVLTTRCIAPQIFLPMTCKFFKINQASYKAIEK